MKVPTLIAGGGGRDPAGVDRAGAEHPDVETWIAYHGGELSEGIADELRAHLARCAHCVELILDIETFVRPRPEDREAVSEFELAAAWRSMKAALAADESAARGGEPARSTRPVRSFQRFAMPLAASLVVAVLGLSTWRQQQTIGELRALTAQLESAAAASTQPQANVTIHDLLPDAVTRSGRSPRHLHLSPEETAVLVVSLGFEDALRSFDSFELELAGEDGEVWSRRGLDSNALDAITLALPPGWLDPGTYQVRLYGWNGEDRELLDGEYPSLRVVAP